MPEISLNILDVAGNSIRARAALVEITVDVQPADDTLAVTVKDNGKGMTEQKVNTIMSEEKNGEKGGFGVYSAVQRIRLFYGIENPISIHSVKDQGTNVKILIRRIEEGIEDGDQGVDRR